ncbi:acyl carrier protein [Paenibacillus apiarius]|nr:acyl carrier protein [Paenibacillus apiarius]
MHAIDTLARLVSEAKEDPSWELRLTPKTNLIEEVGLDSLQLIQFMLKVEEQFKVQMDFERFDYEHLQSVRAFLGFLQALGAEVGLHA